MKYKDKVWLAGFMDGEGCISSTATMGHRNLSPNNTLIIKTTNTNLSLLHHCQSIAGGSIVKQKTYGINHKQIWQWILCANKAMQVLRDISPHLIGKREVAKLGISLQETINKNKRKKITPEEAKCRYLIVEQMRTINHRGL